MRLDKGFDIYVREYVTKCFMKYIKIHHKKNYFIYKKNCRNGDMDDINCIPTDVCHKIYYKGLTSIVEAELEWIENHNCFELFFSGMKEINYYQVLQKLIMLVLEDLDKIKRWSTLSHNPNYSYDLERRTELNNESESFLQAHPQIINHITLYGTIKRDRQ